MPVVAFSRLARVAAASALSLVAIATVFVTAATAAFPGANGKIAFVESRPGYSSEVMVARADGSGVTDLTNHVGQDLHPAWSPDGRRIAFTRADFSGSSKVFVMNADGTGVTPLTDDFRSSNPTWSPDGTKIAYLAPGKESEDIWVMNADGSGEPTRITETSGFESNPSWSPDGTEIVFVGSPWRIFKSPADGSDLTPTPLTAGDTQGYPDWSPDGTKIAYAALPGEGPWQVYLMNPDGSEQTLVSTSFEASNPAWSPDGGKLLVDANGSLITIKPDGSEPQPLGLTGGQPSWQPLVEGQYPPVASFTSPSNPVLQGAPVKFTSTSTPGNGEISSLAWDLDNDGVFDDATGPSAAAAFDPGIRTIRLSVLNDQGYRDAIAAQIEVVPPPETDIHQDTVPVRDNTPTFTFSSEVPGNSFECQLDGGGFAPCASPYTAAPLLDGVHAFEVRARDANGFIDPSPAKLVFSIDTLPETSIHSVPPPASNRATFTFGADQPSRFECRLDGGRWAPCTSPWTYSGLPDGSHSFEVVAIDSTGNGDPSPAVVFWSIDATPPQLRLKASKRQNAVAKRGVVTSVACPTEACKLRAKGTIAVGAKLVRLKAAQAATASGGRVSLKLALTGKKLKLVRAALAAGRKLEAEIEVSGEDALGNVTEQELTVQLLGVKPRGRR